MVLLIAGSRSFQDYQTFSKICDEILKNIDKNNITIVSGGARGADSLAETYARIHKYNIKVFPAQWDVYGKSAGYRRNEQMHQYINCFKERMVLCFWDGASKGTRHNFELCRAYNNPLKVYLYNENRFM